MAGKVEEVILLLSAFSVPFVNFAPVPSVIASLMLLVLWVKAFAEGRRPAANWAAAAMLAFYLYAILSSVSYGLSEKFWRETVEIRLPMLLFSLALLFSPGNVDVRRMLRWFAMGAFACAAVCTFVYLAAIVTDFDDIPRSVMNLKLCLNGVLSLISHRTYVSFNLLVGLAVLFQDAMERESKRGWLLFGGLTIPTALFILFSGARMVMVSFCLLLFLCLVVFLSHRYDRKRMLLFSLLALGGLGALLAMNERLQDTVISLYRGDMDPSAIDPRYSIWYCAWQVLQNNDLPFMGVGTGMSPKLLFVEYEAFDFVTGMQETFNMHNQFFEAFIEYGWIGLMLLVAMLLPSFLCKANNRLFFKLYAFLLVSNFMFESMFCRSMGTYSIAFIIALSGVRSEREQAAEIGLTLRKGLYLLLLAAVAAVSVKYISKDKRKHFSSFQRYFERVEVLPGEVPSELIGTKGLRADCRTTSEQWRDLATTYHRIDQFVVSEADSVSFSLWVYLSDDFDGTGVEIKLEERRNLIYSTQYDQAEKGTWQHLHIGRSGMHGSVVCTFAFSKEKATDLNDLKGFVIFAKPETECIRR